MTELVVDDADGAHQVAEQGEPPKASTTASRRQKVALLCLSLLVVLGIGVGVFSQMGGDSKSSGPAVILPANMFELALQLHQSGQYDQALAAYRSVLETDPGSALAHYNIGQIYQVRGDLAGAVAEYNKALQANPDLVAAIYNRALAHRDQGKNADAIKGLDSVLGREPDNIGALYNLGNILIAEGRTNEGTKLVNRAIELDPSLLQGK